MVALFNDVKSAFSSVHHPRLLDTLAKEGVNHEILNIIHKFLADCDTHLAFTRFESGDFKLTHGLPQGSPLSPLLYLLYNTTLLEIADKTEDAEALGFVDNVILLTSANDTHQLKAQLKTLAFRQSHRANNHSAIFDVAKSNWVLFTPNQPPSTPTIDFSDRK